MGLCDAMTHTEPLYGNYRTCMMRDMNSTEQQTTRMMTVNKQRWATLAHICREIGGTVVPFEDSAVAGPQNATLAREA
jgi:hypothetical protein